MFVKVTLSRLTSYWFIKRLLPLSFVVPTQTKSKREKALSKLKRLTTLTQEEFEKLYTKFAPMMEAKLELYTLKGELRKIRKYKESSLSSLSGSRTKLEFILLYLKEHPSQDFMANTYAMSQSKVSEWITYILPVLRESLNKLGVLPSRGSDFSIREDLDCILCDVTERQVNRSIDMEVQKEYYSGKKKSHTVKNLAFADTDRYIHYLGDTFEGSVHDKAMWDEVSIAPSGINILVDLGFLGAEKDHQNVILPYKNTKLKKLTKLQEQVNKGISSVRIRVEHAFAGVKRLKIVKEKINLRTNEIIDQVMLVAVGLHNLRTRFRCINFKP